MQYASTIWKRQARRTWRRQVADTAASATRRFAADFAFAASGMYPELQWPLIDHLNRHDSAEGTPPPRYAGERERIGMSDSHAVSAHQRDGVAVGRSMSQPLEWRAVANDCVQCGNLPRLAADRGDLPGRPVAPAAPAGRSIPAWIPSLASLPGLLWRRLRREREMRRDLAELKTLDDRTLKDIGLSRYDIGLIAGGEHRWPY
jgi:uncharacterized protein YjiS (DUF1127 family)